MATKKTKSSPKTAAKKKAAGKSKAKKPAAKKKKAAPSAGPVAPNGGSTGLRVRMYRVGFGDFFLVTVPSSSGPKHVLIDCGVHSKDTHSIGAAVAHMAQETNKELSLIIVTHRHADHVTGFSKCKDIFKDFKVGRIWMSFYEDPGDKNAVALQANIVAKASQLQQALAARNDPESEQYLNMVSNITEGMGVSGGTQNPGAFEMLRGFPGKPPIDYYKAADVPSLPPELVEAGLSAQILGPPDDRVMLSKTDKASEEFIASQAAAQTDTTTTGPLTPFDKAFVIQPDEYESDAFDLIPRTEIEARVADVQPDLAAAKAGIANNMINNQSLITLLTFKGKTLLFAGDAQWGNWANFLFGNLNSTTLRNESAAILGKLDFYKVGHHGSTNATPKDALAAMREGCVAMCSTAIGAYNEVPRDALITAIDEKTNQQLARSDQVKAGNAKADPDAGKMPKIFTATSVDIADSICGYIDYVV